MGKYHPHGDSSIYGSLVNMAQPWSMRYTLVDGHGNFGSVDGDGAAAMRYTEARLTKISMEMLADINKDTVTFVHNFDETEKEPSVLPSRFPNLLVNGTTGIAVGMATNIPPHNLREAVAGVTKIIDNKIEEDRDTDISELLPIIKAPDFPTGGIIMGTSGATQAYLTGKGKVITRAVTDIEAMQNGKHRIIVTELPYLVNKANLIQKIAELVKTKRIEGITDLRDESDREGMRIVIELRHDANPNIVLNRLFKHTQMQDTFGITMLALVNNEPKVMNLLDMLMHYLRHQEDVVTRRTRYDLNKAEERDHILQGLLIALDNIDEVVKIIRESPNVAAAKTSLIERFGLDDVQAQAIVDMRLRALTGLEREKLEKEHQDLLARIAELKEILADPKKLLAVIKEEINIIADKYGDERRSRIESDASDFEIEDLIKNENVVIARTSLGYIKRMTEDNFRVQGRGGRGIKGIQTLDNDYIEDLLMTRTHDNIMFFTSLGRAYKLKAYKIPEASRNSRGTAIVNLLSLLPEEKITAIIPLMDENEDKNNLFMATKSGTVKKTPLNDFKNIRNIGIIAINLKEGDELIDVKQTNADNDIFLVTANGMCIRFSEKDVRSMGRSATGVRGISLSDGDEVVAMQIDTQGDSLLFATENGMGKRTLLSEFRPQKRGGMGLKCYQITKKTGKLIGCKAVTEEHEVMMINTAGIIIQLRASDFNPIGRITQGVKMMNLDEGVKVVQIAKVRGSVDKNLPETEADGVNEGLPETEADGVDDKLPESDADAVNKDLPESDANDVNEDLPE
jgi:DNA gyrase subunit A